MLLTFSIILGLGLWSACVFCWIFSTEFPPIEANQAKEERCQRLESPEDKFDKL